MGEGFAQDANKESTDGGTCFFVVVVQDLDHLWCANINMNLEAAERTVGPQGGSKASHIQEKCCIEQRLRLLR